MWKKEKEKTFLETVTITLVLILSVCKSLKDKVMSHTRLFFNDMFKVSPGGRPSRGFTPFSAHGSGSCKSRRHNKTPEEHSHTLLCISCRCFAYSDNVYIHGDIQAFGLLRSVFLQKTTDHVREILGVWSQKEAHGSVMRLKTREFKGAMRDFYHCHIQARKNWNKPVH